MLCFTCVMEYTYMWIRTKNKQTKTPDSSEGAQEDKCKIYTSEEYTNIDCLIILL